MASVLSRSTRWVLALYLLIAKIAAQNVNYFVSPPSYGTNKVFTNNNILTLGDVITIAWNTSYTGATLWLWQDANPSGAVLASNLQLSDSGLATYTWTVDLSGLGLYTLNPSNVTYDSNGVGWYTNVFFFEISNSGNKARFNSHYVNLTSRSVTSSSKASSSATSATSTPASISSLVAASSNTATSDDSSGENNGGKSGLSDAAKVGIGVGVGVGVGALLLGFAAAYFLLRHVRKQKDGASGAAGQSSHAPIGSNDPSQPVNHKYAPIQQPYSSPPLTNQPHELGTHGDPHELATRNY